MDRSGRRDTPPDLRAAARDLDVAGAPPIATPVSPPRPRPAPRSPSKPGAPLRAALARLSQLALSRMAHAALLPLIGLPLTGCLVTSTPPFDEPEQSRPFLLDATAIPEVRSIQVIDVTTLSAGGADPRFEFSVGVVSEDVGDRVVGHLVRDYGIPSANGPYLDLIKITSVDPATLDEPPRTLAAVWGLNTAVPLGCHYISLLATHDMDDVTGCPRDADDFDVITWTVFVCQSGMTPCCDPTRPPEDGGCDTFQCPVIDPQVRCGVPLQPSSADPSAQGASRTGGAP